MNILAVFHGMKRAKGLIVPAILLAAFGWQIIRAERAERKLAQCRSDVPVLQAKIKNLEDDLAQAAVTIKSYTDAAKESGQRKAAGAKKARKITQRTRAKVQEVMATPVPSDCTQAIEWGATQAPIIAEWGTKL